MNCISFLLVESEVHKSFGGRSVGYGGLKLWNTLPKEPKTCTNINTFKKLLNTFLFKEA